MKWMRRLSLQVLMLVAVITALSGPSGEAASAPSDRSRYLVQPGTLPATNSSYRSRYLVRPGPLPATNGIRLDDKGRLYVLQNTLSRVHRLDLGDRSLKLLLDENHHVPLKFPDDLVIDTRGTRDVPTGTLYFTEPFNRTVSRMRPDPERKGRFLDPEQVAAGITDGRTAPNGIAFDKTGRLFVTDMMFDPSHPGGIWEVKLPNGPAYPVVRGIPSPNAFDFGPDNIAYVPTDWHGSIWEVNVDAVPPTVKEYAKGFGNLTALKVDPQGRLVVLESDTGKVWRVTGRNDNDEDRTELAQGQRGFDNLEIDTDGTIYVSNFLTGNIGRVDEATKTIVPLLPESRLSLPVSVSEAPDGSLLVANVGSLARVAPNGDVTHIHVPFLDEKSLGTAGAVEIEATETITKSFYFTEFLPPRLHRICRQDTSQEQKPQHQKKSCETIVEAGLVVPWHIRRGPTDPLLGEQLLVTDQGTGSLLQVDPDNRTSIPLATGLLKPAGLAYDAQHDKIYVSENQRGQVVEIERLTGERRTVVEGLSSPEGVAVDGEHLLVVEAGKARLLRFKIAGGAAPEVIATGLPTSARGALPAFLDFTSDVLVRSNGTIVVTGSADGSLIEISKQ